jgi:hypothetical protein
MVNARGDCATSDEDGRLRAIQAASVTTSFMETSRRTLYSYFAP